MPDSTRQLILDLLARAKTREATNEVADDLEKVAKAADEAETHTGRLGDTSEKTGHAVDKMGNDLETTKGRISGLDKEIENVSKELKTMAGQFADAGTAAERNDISKAIRKTQTELRTLTKNKSVLEDLLPSDEKPTTFLQNLKQNLSSGFQSIGLEDAPLLATSLAGAAPLLGAVISGAVVGAVGAGGIVGGLLIASKDARVKSAMSNLKTEIGDDLKDAASPFVPVALSALGKVKSAFEGINFKDIFQEAATQSTPLIDGVINLVSDLGSAIDQVLKNSGPVIKEIGQGLSEVGKALSDGLVEISKNSQGNADALKDLFRLIDGGIRTVFGLVDAFTQVYEIGRKVSLGGLIDQINILQLEHKKVAGAVTEFAEASIQGAAATADLTKKQDDEARAAYGQRDALQAVSKELKAQTDPAFAVLDAMDKVKTAQNNAATATKKYGANSQEARAASRQLAEAAIDLQGDVGALGGSFDGKLTPTMKRTLSAAGLTKGQIKGVEEELRRAKSAADAYEGTYVAEIITNYTYNQGGADYNRELGNFQHRASGGPVNVGEPYIVGENGQEIFVPDQAGRILSASASRGLMSSSGSSTSSGYGRARQLQLVVDGGDQRLVSLLKYLIRTANLIEVDG